MGKNKSEILAVLVVGVLMSAIDITIVILALPTIDSGLHSGIALSIWVIMAYILVMTVLSTQVGKLGDKFGRAKLYNYGLGIFVVGSALCGLSPDIYALIGFRALQAVGGALIGTSSSAVVSDNFEPHERGKAFGFTSLGWNLGSIFGIFLGGLLATINWRLIFLINVPIGIVLLPISIRKLRDVKESIKERFDILGSLILGAGLFTLTIAAVYYIFRNRSAIPGYDISINPALHSLHNQGAHDTVRYNRLRHIQEQDLHILRALQHVAVHRQLLGPLRTDTIPARGTRTQPVHSEHIPAARIRDGGDLRA